MATKMTNREASFFVDLVNGKTIKEIQESIIKRISNYQWRTKVSDEVIVNEKQYEFNKLMEVKEFFDKVKLFEEKETYSVMGWGYGQTNYENFMVVGQIGGSMVCILDCGNYVFTVSKAKYLKKEFAWLDNSKVRATKWDEPFTKEEIMEQNQYNAYYGH
ncbi:MAG TPA: hypothetical protein PLN85_01170 [archaeon]|jgi:hypothetical protein|nr:hypothetical protein [archaeon]